MIKFHISTTCTYCNGEAYVPYGQATTRFLPCPVCKGAGEMEKWVSLSEFQVLLEQDPMQPNYQTLARQLPISLYQDSCDAAGT